jgi:hypothetical protein
MIRVPPQVTTRSYLMKGSIMAVVNKWEYFYFYKVGGGAVNS